MKSSLLALLLCLAGLAQAAVEVAGAGFPDTQLLGTTELRLNGAGQRSRLFFRVYAVGLYLTEKRSDASEVLTLKGPKRLQIVTLRKLTAEQFADALVGGIRKNHSDAELTSLNARVEEFKGAIMAVKTAAKGDIISIEWLPESGTRLSVNDRQQGKDVVGEDFYHALLKIWLGAKPAQEDLKEALLGK